MGKYTEARVVHFQAPLTPDSWSIFASGFGTIATTCDSRELPNLDRLVSCWNACTQLENPEPNIPKLIEVVKSVKQDLELAQGEWVSVHKNYAPSHVTKYKELVEDIDEALASVKE